MDKARLRDTVDRLSTLIEEYKDKVRYWRLYDAIAIAYDEALTALNETEEVKSETKIHP